MRHGLVRVQEQDAEQRPLLGGAEPDRLLPLMHLKRPEDQELHATASDERRSDRTTRLDRFSSRAQARLHGAVGAFVAQPMERSKR